MDILGCISLWYEGTVIGYGDARQRMYEVLSVREEAVAGDTVLPAGRMVGLLLSAVTFTMPAGRWGSSPLHSGVMLRILAWSILPREP